MRDRAGGKEMRPGVGEPLQQPAEREDEQRRAADQDVDHPKARLRGGVVGRLLVRGQRDRPGEGRRQRIAMRIHVADLPRREP